MESRFGSRTIRTMTNIVPRQYLQAYNGVKEPQARTTEHMHAFLHVLGYTTPEEFFEQGDFCDQFRRLWSFAASICFFSQEAVARQCGTEGSVTPDREQLAAIGHDAAKETLRTQRLARGLPPDPPASEAAMNIAARTLPTEDVTATVAPSNAAASESFTAENRSENDNAAPNEFGIVTEAVSVERTAVIQPNALVNWSPEYFGQARSFCRAMGEASCQGKLRRHGTLWQSQMQKVYLLETKSQSKT